MLKIYCLFGLIIVYLVKYVVTQEDSITLAFNNFKIKYSKNYSDSVMQSLSLQNYKTNSMTLSRQQLKFFSGVSKFLLKTNARFDQNKTQKATWNGLVLDSIEDSIQARAVQPTYPIPPASLDYRQMGLVTGVLDQGETCSSCYAFAAACALEGQVAKKYARLTLLSEQNIVDCSRNISFGNYGCGGGSVATSFKYVVRNLGIANDTLYPYNGFEKNCSYNPSIAAEKATAYAFVTGDETYLKSALAAIGPLAIGVRSDLDSFYYYGSGIYDDPMCDTAINHAMCLVGYGTDSSTSPPTDYWIVKNSWSSEWGENGYMRMIMGRNICGITNYVVYPKV